MHVKHTHVRVNVVYYTEAFHFSFIFWVLACETWVGCKEGLNCLGVDDCETEALLSLRFRLVVVEVTALLIYEYWNLGHSTTVIVGVANSPACSSNLDHTYVRGAIR